MRLKKQERAAIEAVSRRLSATWEEGSDAPAAYFTVAGKRVVLDIATLKRRGRGHGNAAKPHLRFDRGAIGLVERLRAALGDAVPNGMAVLLTITAPIRVRAKTAATLEDRIRTLLRRGSPARDTKDTIYGNRVRIRFVRDASQQTPKLIGFVHNPESDPLRLLKMTRDLLELDRAEPGRRRPRPADDRWLLVTSAEGMSALDAYRYIYSQLRVSADYKKVFIAFSDGRVGMLTE